MCRSRSRRSVEAKVVKVPISEHFVIDLDAPTLPAFAHVDSDGRVLWSVWCSHCQQQHWHGPGEGHRIAHCQEPASLYDEKGYNLARADI